MAQTEIEVTVGTRDTDVPVRVAGSHEPRSLHFENDILPILSRFGCNSSGCHGKAEGQNGFKLSIFGFDPPADRLALLEEGRGRRIFPAAPEESLILKKASASIPHGGGLRIQKASPEYRTAPRMDRGGGARGRSGRSARGFDPGDAARTANADARGPAASRRGPLQRRARSRRHPPRQVPIEPRRAGAGRQFRTGDGGRSSGRGGRDGGLHGGRRRLSGTRSARAVPARNRQLEHVRKAAAIQLHRSPGRREAQARCNIVPSAALHR